LGIGINKAIYNKDDVEIMFGKNKNLENSRMNDSTSQIYNEDDNVENCYKIKTITIESIINEYKIDPNNISLIKVDIEGGEEYILEDLYNIYTKYKIPMYISFHYTWWKNNDLERFKLISEEQRNFIINYPFESILYE
jgi:FkbM family methyltransferase